MLKVMRESFQHLKWILVFIIALFVLLVFVDWGAGGATGGSAEPSYAARVNSATVSLQDYTRALYFAEQRFEQAYGQKLTPQMRQMFGLEQQVLTSLIDEKLMLQEARKLDLVATDAEIRNRILEIPELNPDGKFVGAELYQRFVTGNLRYPTVADFEDELARDITLRKIESALASTVVIPPQVLEAEYRRQNENVRVRYLLYPGERVAESVTVAPAEVEAYYKANNTRYAHGDQRRIKYLVADVAQVRSRINPSEQEMLAYYERTKESYKTAEAVRAQHILIPASPQATPAEDAAARGRAEDLIRQIRAGADFAELARQHSADPGSATLGGDVGVIERGRMVPEFEKAAFDLQPGQISEPVKTQFGYHILRGGARVPAGYRTLEEVKPQLRMQLIDERAKTMARDAAAQAKARLDQAKPTAEDKVREVANSIPNVALNDSQWFDKGGEIFGLGPMPALSEWAFTAKKNEVSPIIETSRGPVVAWLAELRTAGVAPLADVRQNVEADARRSKAAETARQQLAQRLQGADLSTVASSLGLTADEATLQRGGTFGGITGGGDRIFDEAMKTNVGGVSGPFAVDQGGVALEVLEKKQFDPATFASEKETFLASLRQTEAQKLRAALLERLRKSSKIVVNEKVVQTSGGPMPPL